MAYEIVTDLRHTAILQNSPDIMTWCNPGPGCLRGLYRIKGWEFEKGNNSTSPVLPPGFDREMIDLLSKVRERLRPKMPPLEMRDLEHSLCEFDKYSRALEGDGRLKRKYPGIA